MKKAVLILNNDKVIHGNGIGATGVFTGELVFTTGMNGYMKSLTDPSFTGQILTFAYPLIGNYGANITWGESGKIWPNAVITSEVCIDPVNKESFVDLDTLLKQNKVGGITAVDTRYLVKLVRDQGTIPVILGVYEDDTIDPVKKVSTKKIYSFNSGGKINIALIDCGFKKSIVQDLVSRGCKVTVFPYTTGAEEILKIKPDGIVVSNGPGDPAVLTDLHKTIAKLLVIDIPFLGICLGHQLLALAVGAKTFKLKYGHRGLNQPVQDILTKKAYITSQNHGYAVDMTTLPLDFFVWFNNLNDDTVEGLKSKNKPFMSVQFHPEANPGPKDTTFIFDEFIKLVNHEK